MIARRILCLGAGAGWHAEQITDACNRHGCELKAATYESLKAEVTSEGTSFHCDAGELTDFDLIFTRTMPLGSFEQITFRLAVLHEVHDRATNGNRGVTGQHQKNGMPLVINPPRSLELAIDKFSTLRQVEALGFRVPETCVVQSRSEALAAFQRLGGDCVVKPIFGGEGRGVMRLKEEELAWYTFSALDRLGSVFYVQKFVPPGGSDLRLLVIGDRVIGIRRENAQDFRANVAGGGVSSGVKVDHSLEAMAHAITRKLGLTYAAVDLLEDPAGIPCVIEVNAIPGWKGAQSVVSFSIADMIVSTLLTAAGDGYRQ